jgi:O-antigen/teichoic acid export membrane protein
MSSGHGIAAFSSSIAHEYASVSLTAAARLRIIAVRQRLRNTLPDGSVRARLVSGTLWSIAAALAGSGIGAIASIVTARLLGRTILGELAMLRVTATLFDAIAVMGLALTANKYVPELRRHDPAACSRVIGLLFIAVVASGLMAGGIMALAAPWIAEQFINAPHLTDYVRFASIVLPLQAVNVVQTGVLVGFEAFARVSRVAVITSVIAAILGVIGVVAGGLPGAVAAWVISTAITCLLSRIALRNEYRLHHVWPEYRNAWREYRVLVAFSLPTTVAGLIYTPAVWIVNALLARSGPSGYGELGIYNACGQWQNLLRFIPAQLLAAAIPIMSSLQRDDAGRFAKSVDVSQSVISMIVVPAAILMAGAAGPIMALYGTDFSHAQVVLIVVLGAAAVMDLGQVASTAIVAIGRAWLGVLVNGFWAVILILVMLWWGRHHGAAGLAGSFLVAYLVLWVCLFAFLRPTLPPGIFFRTVCGLALLLSSLAILSALPNTVRLAAALPLSAATLAILYKRLISSDVRSGITEIVGRVTQPWRREVRQRAFESGDV